MKLMDYKGYEIQIDDMGEFQAVKGGVVEFKNIKLDKLKKQIDKVGQPVIVHLRGDFVEAKITSTSEKNEKYFAWVSLKPKICYPNVEERVVDVERAKTQLEQLIKPTEENREIVGQINYLKEQQNELVKQAKELEDSISTLANLLERFTAKDFGLGEKG